MDWEELESALAWFRSAPSDWLKSKKQDLAAAAEWIWEVIQGDFAEEQTTAQVVTGTVISMIPFVDQLCDVRDVVANCTKIDKDSTDKWAWIALILTLIGLFPVLGSLAKGCCKIMFAYGRKSTFKVAKSVLDADFWKASKPFVEASIAKLNQHLKNPQVRAALKAARITNPFKWLADKVRVVGAKLNTRELERAFDTVIEALRYFVGQIKRFGSAAMATRAGQLLDKVLTIRNSMNRKIDECLAPVSLWLSKLARRLDIEADMLYRANTNAVNPHHYRGVSNDAEEVQHFVAAKPAWVATGTRMKFSPLVVQPHAPGWPDISSTSVSVPLNSKYQTFHSAKPVVIPEGEEIYRVLDPASADNSICWMRKAEFEKLKSKGDWRRNFAVKGHWNANGEYVTYKVPKGGLPAWEGATASQRYENSSYVLEGGAIQLVVDPAQLETGLTSARRSTGWGYTEFSMGNISMVGVPTLKNNWYGMKP